MAKNAPPDRIPRRLFSHVLFECNHADDVMTAWALGPVDKSKLMTMFLVEAQRNAQVLSDRQQPLDRLDREARSASQAARGNRSGDRMATNLISDLVQAEADRQREENEPIPAGGGAPHGAESVTGAVASGQRGRRGWVYLGQYDDQKDAWVTQYFETPQGGPPPAPNLPHPPAATGALSTQGRVNVRPRMPDENATFSAPIAVLQPHTAVSLAARPVRWQGTGFIWAEVTY